MPLISNFKQWRNGEVFNATSYVYERDTIVNQLNRLSILVGDTGSDSTITVGGLSTTGTVSAGTVSAASVTASGSVSAGSFSTINSVSTGSLSTNSITMGGVTIASFDDAGTKVNLSTSAPSNQDGSNGEVWIEYSE